ncbi:MAG TPA: YihY/virulence factor BrkB family protein [Flavobacterium sp.]|uniref:YihY/virulence factor BrkB family protein n=1 Tax=Flavobacterium sp. TaxID=239 RepID=UPI002CB22E2C|nr:YihY/virulence factor BrkB family protein [Flavobacterium sp.]HNP32491.1 YihY/virulence factor BrkB family protein [Flavobacterium sp.]
MSEEKKESKIKNLPVIKQLLLLLQSIKLPWLHGMSLYDLLDLYFTGIAKGAISYRASAIAWSFFMALFPFMLFILNLIPYIPIKGFQDDFLGFVQENVPPTTYDAIYKIINDILHNSHSGLLSTGFLMAILLMTNGVNAILGGFESGHHVHVTLKRNFFRQYFVALGLSIILSFVLLITVAVIVIFEVFIQKTKIQDVLSDNIPLIEMGRYIFLILMILMTTSILFKFGIRHDKNRPFISIGSVFTTILIIISSYFFGIWVVKFSKYNELYGSIGTLLVVMFYIWINCMILLLGFDLNASIQHIKREKQKELDSQ